MSGLRAVNNLAMNEQGLIELGVRAGVLCLRTHRYFMQLNPYYITLMQYTSKPKTIKYEIHNKMVTSKYAMFTI